MRSKPDEKPPASDARDASPVAADLAGAVQRFWRDRAFLSDLRELFGRVDAAVARRGADCWGGGACCKFDLMGHRLYLATGELALLAMQPPPPGAPRPLRCPYQVGPRCSARGRRPLGCRLFFCRDTPDWSARAYERFHRRIRRLHDAHRLPYAYGELTGWLAQLSALFALTPSGAATSMSEQLALRDVSGR